MNSLRYLILVVIAILNFQIQISNGFVLSLCLEEILNDKCECDWTNSNSSSSEPSESNEDARKVFQKGFDDYQFNVEATKNKTLEVLSRGYNLANQPQVAAEEVKKGIQDALNLFFETAVYIFLALGEGSKLSNDKVKPCAEISGEKLQMVAVVALDALKNIPILAQQAAMANNSKLFEEVIEASRKSIEAVFTPIFDENEITRNKIMDALSSHGCKSVSKQDPDSDAAAKNSYISNAISKINEYADAAIKNGASKTKVNSLRKEFIRQLQNIAAVISNVRKYVAVTQKLADSNPSTAKDFYLKQSKGVCRSISKIFVNICLDLGAKAVNTDNSTRTKLGDSIRSVTLGNDAIITGNKNAKVLTLYGAPFGGNVSKLAFEASAQTANYGGSSFVQSILNAAKMAFTTC